MFCSQCGKKVLDTMLFCPFCGAPIVIPDQTDAVAPERQRAPANGDADAAQPAQPQANVSPESAVGSAGLPAEGRSGGEAQAPMAEPARACEGDAAEAAPARDPAARSHADDFEPLDVQDDWVREDAARSRADDFEPLDVQDDWVREDAAQAERFEPLDLESLGESGAPEPPVAPSGTEGISDLLSSKLREAPVRLQGHVPDLSDVHPPKPEHAGARKPPDTRVPPKAFNPNDMFLDGGADADDEEDFAYEEPERGGCLMRHIRGLVALSLTVLVLAIVAIWAVTDAGQRALAQANLAWRADIYGSIAYESYQDGDYLRAATFYERALSRDADNYTYANIAGIASYYAGDSEQAAEMAKRAVAIDPEKSDAYALLLRIYPDADARPWEIDQLLQEGARLTGDDSLAGQ